LNAVRAANFIENNFIDSDGRMTRSWYSGKSKIDGLLNDYAYTADAFISLYQLTFEEKWLTQAKNLTELVLKEFSQEDTPLFWYLPGNYKDLQLSKISRILETNDGVEPSGNSIMAKVLLILGNYFENEEYIERSAQMCRYMMKNITSYPSYYSQWALVSAMHSKGLDLIAITGDKALHFADKLKSTYNPFTVVAASVSESAIPSLTGKFRDNKTLIYKCRNHVCDAPVAGIEELTF